MLTCLVTVLFTFYIQGVLKLKNNSGAKGFIFFFIPIPHALSSPTICKKFSVMLTDYV